MTTRRTATRLPMLIATIAMIVGLMPAAPATAHPGSAVLVTGTAHLPTFPCPAPSQCGGTFSGSALLAATAAPDAGLGALVTGSFVYTDDCATGTATGTLAIVGGLPGTSETLHFSWTRVGLTAVLVFDMGHDGVGVAAFVPDTGVTACVPGSPSGALNATVAGAGAWL